MLFTCSFRTSSAFGVGVRVTIGLALAFALAVSINLGVCFRFTGDIEHGINFTQAHLFILRKKFKSVESIQIKKRTSLLGASDIYIADKAIEHASQTYLVASVWAARSATDAIAV